MRIYRVQFKDGNRRIYGSDVAYHIGDTVVVDSSHGPLVAEISEELESLPASMAGEKLRYILCRIPMEEVERRREQREMLEVEKEKREAEERRNRRKERQEELLADMRAVMKSDSRWEAVMFRLFAEYDQEFGRLYKEYCAFNDECEGPVPEKALFYLISGFGC